MFIKPILTMIGCSAVLAGCAGGDASRADFDEFAALGQSILEDARSTDSADLPDSAEMSGYLAAGSEEGNSLVVGDATATADFTSGDLTGSATNFTDFELSGDCEAFGPSCTGTPILDYDGTLDIAGEITGTAFDFEVGGQVSAEVEGQTIVTEVTMEGDGTFGELDGELIALGSAEGSTEIIEGRAVGVDDLVGFLFLIED